MRLKKAISLSINALVHRKLRSWLTILGIVMGVSAVVAIVSIGEGLQQSVETRLMGFGADLITINPGGGRARSTFRMMHGGSDGAATTNGKNLTYRDVQAIKLISNVDVVMGTVSDRAEIYFLGESSSVSVSGIQPLEWAKITTSELASGRFLSPSDYTSVVIGSSVANDMFKQTITLNRILTIEGKSFKVVGILEATGTGDGSIYIPIDAARDLLDGVGKEEFDSISVKVENVDFIDQAIEDIDSRLMLLRHVTEVTKDYSISSFKDIQETIIETTQAITVFLGAIAAVSLLVGAVGIANSMFTSVLEKTKEIGIMKAIGAKNSDILVIFLLNSVFVGAVGGGIGILFGVFASSLLPSILGGGMMMGPGAGGGFTTVITPWLLAFSMGLSIIIGAIAGFIPAYRASKLKPVDALRYE